ncbi:MAG: DMT family transporter [Sedimentisphaerales bacterium]|nr:DMT family transporter [Sedimentisphaerales bacterium]
MDAPATRKIDPAATSAILVAIACWAGAPIFIKLLTAEVDSWTQNVLRYGTACLFWLPFLFYAMRTGRFQKRIWWLALLPSVPNIILQAFWAAAFYHVDPAFMDLMVKSSVIWIAAFSLIFFEQERALLRSKRFWSGMLLSMVGVGGVILYHPEFKTPDTTIGTGMALAAAFGWAIYAITVKITFKNVDSRVGFSVISLYTTLGLAALAWLFGDMSVALNLSAKVWTWVIVSAITGIALSHVLYYAAIKRIGATIPSLALLATPIFVYALSYLVLGETLSLRQGLFGLILLFGAGVSIWSQQHLGKAISRR